jgi:inosose dehydratase
MLRFDSEYLRINFDTGNSYIAGKDPLVFLKSVHKWVSHCHLKDVSASLASVERGVSTGIATSLSSIGAGVNAKNIAACIQYLTQTKGDGVLSIECEAKKAILHPSVKWMRTQIGAASASLRVAETEHLEQAKHIA